MMRYLYGALFVFGYATYVASHLLFSVVLVPFAALVLHGRLRRRFFSRVFHASIAFFIKGYFPALGGYRFAEVSGVERARAAEPAVYVVNHRGRMDGLFVLAWVRRAGVVMKSAYIRQPLFATFARYFNFVSVDADSVSTLAQTLERCSAILASGRSLLVFPEGTRAPGPRMLPFRDTAFRLAQLAGVPVVPVVVHTDVPVLGKRMARIAPVRHFRVTLRFLEPVRIGKDERPGEIAGRVERLIASHLAELDKGTVWETMAGGRLPKAAANGERP